MVRALARADAAFLTHDTLEIAVQVNGKLRGRFPAPAGSSDDELSGLPGRSPTSRATCRAHELVRVIVVPGKLVNFVVR